MANIYLGGTDLSSATLKMGSTDVSAAYLGSTEVWTPPYVITNLDLALDANDTNSYPGTGNTWSTLYGSYDGTITNSPTFQSGTPAYFDFSNSSTEQSVDISQNLWSSVGDFAMEIWFWMDTQVNNNRIIDSLTGGSSDFFFIRWSSGFNYRMSANGTSVFNVTDTTSGRWDTGEWHQFVVTRDGTEVRAYRNGTKINTITGVTTNTYTADNTIQIANSAVNTNLSNGLDGRVSIARYYGAALSDADVTQNFNADKDKFGL